MKRNKNPIYYQPRSRGRHFGAEELTDEQINAWWEKVKHLPYNPRRDWDHQGSIGHNVFFRDGQFNQPFKNDKRKGG